MFMCVLPYHETNYFVRALQMLDLENRNGSVGVSLWTWLLDNQKQRIALAPSSLATNLYGDFSFLNFINEYLKECLKQFGDESDLDSLSQERNLKNALNFSISFLTTPDSIRCCSKPSRSRCPTLSTPTSKLRSKKSSTSFTSHCV